MSDTLPVPVSAEATPDQPVRLQIDYPEQSSRLLALLALLLFLPKVILLVPHIIIMWFLGLAALFVMIIGYFAVLFTGRYPRGLFDFLLGYMRWQTRMNAWMWGLTDAYPPFRLDT
jgi:pilus assembly protein TadC